jgi:hypothetical protein
MPSRQYYNRYNNFVVNGQQTVVPYVNLRSKSTDKRFIYKVGQSRLDKISQQYYGTPYFGWLIMMANPILTIPFPLVASLQDYNNALNNHFFYYGR